MKNDIAAFGFPLPFCLYYYNVLHFAFISFIDGDSSYGACMRGRDRVYDFPVFIVLALVRNLILG